MSADFTPSLNDYSNQQQFSFWCQKIIPLVYDDSLSYYEILAKMADYINNLVEDLATMANNIEALSVAYDSLEDYVNNILGDIKEV